MALLQTILALLTASVGTPAQSQAIVLANQAIGIAQQAIDNQLSTSTAPIVNLPATSTTPALPQASEPIQQTPTQTAESTAASIQPQKPMDYTINLKVFVNGIEATGQTFTGKTGEKFRITYQATSNAGEAIGFQVQNRPVENSGYDYESDQTGDQNVSVRAVGFQTGTQTEKTLQFNLTAEAAQ